MELVAIFGKSIVWAAEPRLRTSQSRHAACNDLQQPQPDRDGPLAEFVTAAKKPAGSLCGCLKRLMIAGTLLPSTTI